MSASKLAMAGEPVEHRLKQNPSCGRRGIWSAFPRGTTIRNLVSAQIPAQYRDAIRVVVDQIFQATAGRLATTFEVVAENPSTVGEYQMVHVALQTAGELQFACGSTGGAACMAYNSPIARGTSWPGGLMRWSVGFDIEALQAVDGSSVAIGADRAAFVAAGLLRP